MNPSQLDSLRRTPARATSSPVRFRRASLFLPALLLGFLLLSLLIFGDRLRPGLSVQTAPALLLDAGTQSAQEATAGHILTQASGWIEPDPYPLYVPVKVDGIVETVEVLAGQLVQKGQLLATLDPVDFEIELKALEAAHSSAQAQQQEKEQAVKRAEAETLRAEAGIEAARARLREQEDRLRRVLALDPGVLPEDERLQVEREVAVGRADLAAAEAEWKGHLAHQDVERAAIESAKARISELQARREQARINLKRTRIYAPIDGRVLKRHASPGGKRMRGMDDPHSAIIVSLYDPQQLQVRVDVPLADAAKMEPGLPARVSLSPFPDQEFRGEITRILGEADLSRNTLQVKVKILDPHPAMRPEMLCRVEFLGLPKSGNPASTSFRTSETVWIPRAALRAGNEVWIVDPLRATASLRSVTPGKETREDYVEIREGIRPGERVILHPPAGLKEGSRVNPLSEESQ
ncbi:MAG: efflux RND transporter periplasmic adaptor subunit [Kiritimatiellia bacterium]